MTDIFPPTPANPDPPGVDAILDCFAAKSYRSISLLTYLVWDIARRDPALSLEPAFRKDRAKQAALNDALNERLGVKIRRRSRGRDILVFSEAARRFFADRPAARTNYAHQLKRAARLAAGLIDLAAIVVRLPNGGLEISGGEVKQIFGMAHVQLTQIITAGQSNPVSFVDVEIYATSKRGRQLDRHSNTRGRLARRQTPARLEATCRGLHHLLSRTATLTSTERSALDELRGAILHALA